jgi:hypothetical protein
MTSKFPQTKSFFAFSQGLFLVFAWRVKDYSLSLRQIIKDVNYEEETFGNSNDVFCDDVGPGTGLWLR